MEFSKRVGKISDFVHTLVPTKGASYNETTKTLEVNLKDEATQEHQDFANNFAAEYIALCDTHELAFQTELALLHQKYEGMVKWEKPIIVVDNAPDPDETIEPITIK